MKYATFTNDRSGQHPIRSRRGYVPIGLWTNVGSEADASDDDIENQPDVPSPYNSEDNI